MVQGSRGCSEQVMEKTLLDGLKPGWVWEELGAASRGLSGVKHGQGP